MRLRTLVRSSGAFWVAPVALAFPLYFFVSNSATFLKFAHGWAPSVVTSADASTASLSYAVAAGLAVWESGRLREAGIWELSPSRARVRTATETLGPVVALAWLMHLVVVAFALVQAHTLPTIDSLRTLLVPFVLSVAHAMVGFAVGCRVWRLIAAPVLAMVVWVLTAMASAVPSPWPRQLSGVYPRRLGFGEIATASSLLPHLLLTGGIALSLVLLWLRRPLWTRVVATTAVAALCASAAYLMVRDSGYSPPVLAGKAPVTCVGVSPKVCMPVATSGDIQLVQKQIESLFAEFGSAGVKPPAHVVVDSLQGPGNRWRASDTVLRAPLTHAVATDSVRLTVLLSAVRFPCDHPEFDQEQQARMWAAETTGEGKAFKGLLQQQLVMSNGRGLSVVEGISRAVDKIRAMPRHAQATWYARTVRSACGDIT